MGKKKLFILLSGYALGIAAALLYNKKDPKKLQAEFDSAKSNDEGVGKVFLQNFIDIHQNLLEKWKTRYWTQENKARLKDLSDTYTKKAKDIFDEYSKKGTEFAKEGAEKLEDFAKDTYAKIKSETPEVYQSAKTKISDTIEDLKSKLSK